MAWKKAHRYVYMHVRARLRLIIDLLRSVVKGCYARFPTHSCPLQYRSHLSATYRRPYFRCERKQSGFARLGLIHVCRSYSIGLLVYQLYSKSVNNIFLHTCAPAAAYLKEGGVWPDEVHVPGIY